jgi:lipid-A-disaccharide synthase-like uncharacterized protein
MNPPEFGNYTEDEVYSMVRQNQKNFGQYGKSIIVKKLLGYICLLPIVSLLGYLAYNAAPVFLLIVGMAAFIGITSLGLILLTDKS